MVWRPSSVCSRHSLIVIFLGTFLWTIVELPVAIICGSAPTLKALFTRFFDSKSTAASPLEVSPGMADHNPQSDNQQRGAMSTSLLPPGSMKYAFSSMSPSDATEMSEAEEELRRLRQKNQGWGPYKTTDASPRCSVEELTSIGKDGTIIKMRHTSESTILCSPASDQTWSAASEMEMGKMLEKASGLLK